MTGPEAARIIGARAELAHVPIILMSGSEPAHTADAVGRVEFLPNPYSRMAIVAIVTHWAQRSKPRTSYNDGGDSKVCFSKSALSVGVHEPRFERSPVRVTREAAPRGAARPASDTR